MQAAWKAMEQLADEGLVLSIGLQDADIDDVSAVMEYARITPAANSLEVHPGNRNDALLAFCRSQVSALPACYCRESIFVDLHCPIYQQRCGLRLSFLGTVKLYNSMPSSVIFMCQGMHCAAWSQQKL